MIKVDFKEHDFVLYVGPNNKAIFEYLDVTNLKGEKTYHEAKLHDKIRDYGYVKTIFGTRVVENDFGGYRTQHYVYVNKQWFDHADEDTLSVLYNEQQKTNHHADSYHLVNDWMNMNKSTVVMMNANDAREYIDHLHKQQNGTRV